MASADSTFRLRLALSYQQRALGLLQDYQAALDAGTVRGQNHEDLKTFYQSQLDRATRMVKESREAERVKAERFRRELAAVRDRQAGFAQDVAQGRLSARRANEENRALLHAIGEREQALAISEANLRAQHADDLGGFIDLRAVEDYERQLGATRPARKRVSAGSLTGLVVGAIVALVIVGMGLGVLGLLPGGVHVSFRAEPIGPAGDPIRITSENLGTEPIAFYVPWPDGTGAASRAIAARDDDAEPSVGIELYVRERGNNDFRLLPVSEGCWSHQGHVLYGSGPIVIEPGLSAEVQFTISRLTTAGVEPDAVRLIFTRADGKRLGDIEQAAGAPQ